MKMKLSLLSPGRDATDIVVDAEPGATVGRVAERIAMAVEPDTGARQPYTLVVSSSAGHTILPPTAAIAEAGIRSGNSVSIGLASSYSAKMTPTAAVVRVVRGPNAGATFDLPTGSSLVGRDADCAVRLSDPLVSKRHARLNVTEVVEIADTHSANGVVVGDAFVDRAVVSSTDVITIGDSQIAVERLGGTASSTTGSSYFNRSPRLDPYYEGVELTAPEPPALPPPARFPIMALLLPVFMGGLLYAVTRSVNSVIFVAFGPLMMVGSFLEQRFGGKRAFRQAVERFHESTADLVLKMQQARDVERTARCREHPAMAEVYEATISQAPLLWTRRIDARSYLELSLGLGIQPSRNRIELPTARNTTPELWSELHEIAAQFAVVDRVPVVAPLMESGAIGVSGPDEQQRAAARGLICQLVGLHSPADVQLAAVLSAGEIPHWSWLKWLPHTTSDHAPVGADLLTGDERAGSTLVAALEELVEVRLDADDKPTVWPTSVVVLIGTDPPVDRARLVALAERGPAAGVHTIWIAPSLGRLPAVCRQFLDVDRNSGETGAGNVIVGSLTFPVEVGLLDAAAAEHFARQLSPLIDANSPLDDQGDLPRSVSFLGELGTEHASDVQSIIERWHNGGSLPTAAGLQRKRSQGLKALVGQGPNGGFELDLRAHGPHALVGGTTGAGKSEFLQTWLIAMAATHSPYRVNFLLVDYKGGSAFGECAKLPHTIGMVTDLTQRLVHRALISLKAEITRRERILKRWRCKDLVELERREKDGAPALPSLIIVVDEFAALIEEIPDFVDGMIDVAQRGRSLGLHLILATQQPAGVIKGKLRANTNLRVALRMADEDDSLDVVGSKIAATFDQAIPGRAIAKTGPGKLTSFQTAYVGGWTADEPPPPDARAFLFPFSTGAELETEVDHQQLEVDPGPTDLSRLVQTISAAAPHAGLPETHRPWRDELAARYELEDLPTERLDSRLVFGVLDDPHGQDQRSVAFEPDRDGNIAAFGTGGSGKSTFIRSLAVAAGLSLRGGPCFVYCLDFGARSLAMLDQLPHVGAVIDGDDTERVVRLISMLREAIDERSARYATVGAGSIVDYRRLADAPNEPRVILAVDGAGAFRQAYELSSNSRTFDSFLSIALVGRQVGVHVVITADRMASIPASLAAAISQRLTLRTADESELGVAGLSLSSFDPTAPPGRGYLGQDEVQVGVLGDGGDAGIAAQLEAMSKLARSMSKHGMAVAPRIERLGTHIPLETLPSSVDGRPALGVSFATLEPVGFTVGGPLVVIGPPASGRTSTVELMIASLRRWRPEMEFVYLGNRRSAIAATGAWRAVEVTPEGITACATQLTQALRTDELDPSLVTVIIEDLPDFVCTDFMNEEGTQQDQALQELLRAARQFGLTVITDGEPASFRQSMPLLTEARSTRHGIALQPDVTDGDSVFSTSFPTLSRSEFPEGRGMYVRAGKVHRVQVAQI